MAKCPGCPGNVQQLGEKLCAKARKNEDAAAAAKKPEKQQLKIWHWQLLLYILGHNNPSSEPPWHLLFGVTTPISFMCSTLLGEAFVFLVYLLLTVKGGWQVGVLQNGGETMKKWKKQPEERGGESWEGSQAKGDRG